MTPRRSAQQAQGRPVMRSAIVSDGEPRCAQGCGFVGYAGPESTPYVNCGGDPGKHIRPPVGASQ